MKSDNIIIWDKIYASGSYINVDQFPTKQLQAFVKHHIIPSEIENKSILEIGCGSGVALKYLANFCSYLTAVDASKNGLSAAKAFNESNDSKIKIDYHLADFRDLSILKSGQFNFVTSEAVLYYGKREDFVIGVNEIYRLLTDGGIARIYTKSDRDTYTFSTSKMIDTELYQVANADVYEFGLDIFCPKIETIRHIFRNFRDIKIGIEEFNHIETERVHSYWIITCTK